MKISEIPLDQLIEDREGAIQSVRICRLALAQGVTQHKDGLSVQYRLDVDSKIIGLIEEEMVRRGIDPECTF